MQIAPLIHEPVRFALHHHQHIYVVQEGLVTVTDPRLNVRTYELPFTPTTWATYSGSVCLYDPEGGIVQFSGSSRALQDSEPGARYSAPYATPLRNGEGLLGPTPYPRGLEERNGALVEKVGGVLRFLTLEAILHEEPVGVFLDPHHHLIVGQDRDRFAYHNGLWGPLLYGELPDVAVPQVLGDVLIAGTPRGLVFSPDGGRSWRERNLGGFGVPTASGLACVRGEELVLLRGLP